MILTEHEIQQALEKAQKAFPHFGDWEYINDADDEYFGFSIWGCYTPHPEEIMPEHFYITLDTYEQTWRGHLSIGQHCYLWSSADMGDAHLVDTEPCKNMEDAIISLKSEIAKLFDAFSAK